MSSLEDVRTPVQDGRFSYYQVNIKLDVCEVALKQKNALPNTYGHWRPLLEQAGRQGIRGM